MPRREASLDLKLIDALLGMSNACADAVRPYLKPKRKEPVALCFAIYIFSRLDLEVVRARLADSLRQILYDTFTQDLVKIFRGVPKSTLNEILTEQLDSYGEIYRTKSEGDAFVAMHNYLEMVLGAASIQKKPALWRRGKDPITIIGFPESFEIRGALAEIEKNIVIPKVKALLDVLTGQVGTKKRSEIKGAAALKLFFRETPEWRVLPEAVTNELAMRLADHQGKAFIDLEHAVIANNLIEKSLIPLCREWGDPKQIILMFAGTLYEMGSESATKMLHLKPDEKDQVRGLYIQTTELLQSALVLEKEHFIAKMRLGYFYNSFGDKEASLRHLEEALIDIDGMKAKPESERSRLESTFMEDPEQIEGLRQKIVGDIETIKGT